MNLDKIGFWKGNRFVLYGPEVICRFCRTRLSRQGDKTQEEGVVANSYDRRIRMLEWKEDDDVVEIQGRRYLHNVGKRRNSTAAEMTFCHTLQVIST